MLQQLATGISATCFSSGAMMQHSNMLQQWGYAAAYNGSMVTNHCMSALFPVATGMVP